MSKRIPQEIKDEVLKKIQSGTSVVDLASQYGISTKTIYTWLSVSTGSPEVSLLKFNKLKRENDELKRIIGLITLDLSREKKGKDR
jgi:transposase